MTKYQGMPLLEAVPVIPKGKPLLQAEELKMCLTKHAIKRFHGRFGFPEDPEQLIKKLNSELQEGWLGEKDGSQIVDFTSYQPISVVAVGKNKKEYLAKTAIKRNEPLILGGYERRTINWTY